MLIINKKLIGYFVLTLIFLQSFGFVLGEKTYIAFFMPIIFLFLSVHIFRHVDSLCELKYLCKYSPFMYLMLFYFWALITVFISLLSGNFYFSSFLNGFIGGLTFSVLLTFLTIFYLFKCKFITIKTILKFLSIFYIFVFLLGIGQFFANNYNLSFFNSIIVFFNNKRGILGGYNPMDNLLINRVQSIFDEPSNLGSFIYANLPIIYTISLTKYKIFKNVFLSKVIKSILIPFAFISLYLTLSPISLIFAVIVTIIYFYKQILCFIKKRFVFFIVIIGLIFIILNYLFIFALNSDNIVIKRILAVLFNLSNFNELIVVEPSLATRLINYAIFSKTGFDNLVFGIGYGSLAKHFVLLLSNTTIPLTTDLNKSLALGTGHPASATYFRVFAETGLLGLFLICKFYYNSFNEMKKIVKIQRKGIVNDFCYSLLIFLLVHLIIVNFYNSTLHDTYFIAIVAISVSIIVKYKSRSH